MVLATVHRSRNGSQELRTVDEMSLMFPSDRKGTGCIIRPFNENESKNIYGGGINRRGREQGGSKNEAELIKDHGVNQERKGD